MTRQNNAFWTHQGICNMLYTVATVRTNPVQALAIPKYSDEIEGGHKISFLAIEL